MRLYRHGLHKMKKAVTQYGLRAIDGRSKLAYALRRWQRELINDLGGEENITTQQRTVIELASTSKLLLGSIDAWLISQPTIVTRNKTLLPVVLQRAQLADGLARYMNQLGLERRHKVKTLHDILNSPDESENHDKPAVNANGKAD